MTVIAHVTEGSGMDLLDRFYKLERGYLESEDSLVERVARFEEVSEPIHIEHDQEENVWFVAGDVMVVRIIHPDTLLEVK